MKDKSLFGLVCAGGGAHGAYQVGVLKYIHEKFCEGSRSPFQIFAGTSCGALNTTFYAAQSFDAFHSRFLLEELWLNFHVPAYHGSLFKNALASLYKKWKKHHGQKNAVWSLLDPKPMQEIVVKGFRRENLEQALKQGSTRGVALAATELLSGQTCWFQEGPAAAAWSLFHSVGILDRITHAHLAASCSVPIFLPPVKIGSHYFLDGSVNLDRPLSAAIHMGATRVLSISTEKPFPDALPHYPTHFQPRLSDAIRLILNRLSHDAARDEAAEIERFNRFYRALSRQGRHLKGEAESPSLSLFHEESLPSHYRPAEIYLLFPSRRIRQGSRLYEPSKEDTVSSGNPPHRRTRFMFHKKFVREMIDLGYHDAKSQHEKLKKFFCTSTPKKYWFTLPRRMQTAAQPSA